MLPDTDGLEICRLIRARSDSPILMLTARGDPMDRVVGLEMGADDYLPKPFEPRELLARLRAILRRRRAGAERATLRRAALRPPGDRPRLARGAPRRRALSAHRLSVRPAAGAGGACRSGHVARRADGRWSRASRSKRSTVRSTCTCPASAPRSRTIRRSRGASSRCAASATCSPKRRTEDSWHSRRPHRQASLDETTYLQVYLTIVASLVLGRAHGRPALAFRRRLSPVQTASSRLPAKCIAELVPPADAPSQVQQQAIDRLAQRLGAGSGAVQPRRRAIAAAGRPLPVPGRNRPQRRMAAHGRRTGRSRLPLPDGRWLVARLPSRQRLSALVLAAFLGAIALVVALGARPVVRRLTGRLERLQRGVESLGAGDLARARQGRRPRRGCAAGAELQSGRRPDREPGRRAQNAARQCVARVADAAHPHPARSRARRDAPRTQGAARERHRRARPTGRRDPSGQPPRRNRAAGCS